MTTTPYFIGDIHGCYTELLLLEEQINLHAKKNALQPFLVSVGDLVDRGPDSKKVVEFFQDKSLTGSGACILGNHEHEFLRNLHAFQPQLFEKLLPWPAYLQTAPQAFIYGERYQSFDSFDSYRDFLYNNWHRQGGKLTLESFAIDILDPDSYLPVIDQLAYLLQLPLFWWDEHYVTSHAMLTSELFERVSSYRLPEHRSAMDDALRTEVVQGDVLQVLWSRELPENKIFTEKFHISGHTPLENPKIDQDLGLAQIDTGCVYGGHLTAYCGGSDEMISVKSQTEWKKATNECKDKRP